MSYMEYPVVLCRVVQIGSYGIHAKLPGSIILYLSEDFLVFKIPVSSGESNMVTITIEPEDITEILGHFERPLRVIFLSTTSDFADSVRGSLNMSENSSHFFDPVSNNDRERQIVFLLNSPLTDEQHNFFKYGFSGRKKFHELDLERATEILKKCLPPAKVRERLPVISAISEAEVELHVGGKRIKQWLRESIGRKKMRHSEEFMDVENSLEDEEQLNAPMPYAGHWLQNIDCVLRCRYIQIGSWKVRPVSGELSLNVFLLKNVISFQAPIVTQPDKLVTLSMKSGDITDVVGHFGTVLPVVFLLTSSSFGQSVRKYLDMYEDDSYFDPDSDDDTLNKIILMTRNVTKKEWSLLQDLTLLGKMIEEVDLETATELLQISVNA